MEKNRVISTLDESTLVIHYMALASYNQILKKDSVIFYINESLNQDTSWVCSLFKNNIKDSPFRPEYLSGVPEGNFFMDNMKEEFLNKLWEICRKEEELNLGKTQGIEKKKNHLDSIYADMLIRDQFYRSEYHNEYDSFRLMQQDLDELNRRVMDSLYEAIGFPSIGKINKQSQNTAWQVLHHSVDCAWNNKWFLRFLREVKRIGGINGWLKQTFHRFYNEETGYCYGKDLIGTKLFISELEKEFPKIYLKLIK